MNIFLARALALFSLLVLTTAVRAGTFTVTTTADEFDTPSGANVSLREALRDAAAAGGADTITFAAALSAQTLTLASEIVVNDATGSVTIDARSLPGGLTLSGGGAKRIFSVSSGSSLTLKGMMFTGGNGAGATLSGSGGAIYNGGTLTLERCTLFGNSASVGGAMFNTADNTLTLTQCTLALNSATSGGAIYNTGSSSSLILTQCTLSGNSATTGGAIYNNGTALTLTNTIIGANTATTGPEVLNTGVASLIYSGKNLIGNLSGSNFNGPAIVVGAPNLAPLGSYGGPTKTMALLPTSPARNATAGTPFTSDQRGFPIVGTPDIGAYEAGTFSNFAAWAIETIGSALAFGGDQDNDGNKNGLEYATRTNPLTGNANPFPAPTPVALQPGNVPAMQFTFPYRSGATDLRYIVQRSPNNLAPWTEIYRLDLTNNTFTTTGGVTGTINSANGTVTVNDPNFFPNATFWRLMVEKP